MTTTPHNPYSPPVDGAEMVPPAGVVSTTSAVPLTFGILCIIFGSLASMYVLLSTTMVGSGLFFARKAADGSGADTAGQVAMIAAAIPFLLILGFSIWMLVIGIGLVRRRAWAVRQARLWGYIGVGFCVLFVGIGAVSGGLMALIPLLVMVLLVLLPMPVLMVLFFNKHRVAHWNLER